MLLGPSLDVSSVVHWAGTLSVSVLDGRASATVQAKSKQTCASIRQRPRRLSIPAWPEAIILNCARGFRSLSLLDIRSKNRPGPWLVAVQALLIVSPRALLLRICGIETAGLWRGIWPSNLS